MTRAPVKEHSEVYWLLRREAEKHFAFLFERGFHFVEEDSEDISLLARVVIAGQRVALRLCFDYRESSIGLRVAKVEAGRADLPSMHLRYFASCVRCATHAWRSGFQSGPPSDAAPGRC
jgi:hypothetical protein